MKYLIILLFVSTQSFADEIKVNLGLGHDVMQKTWQTKSPIFLGEIEYQNDWCKCSVTYQHLSIAFENKELEPHSDIIFIEKSWSVYSW